MKRRRFSALVAMFGLFVAACNGHAVLVEERSGDTTIAGAATGEGNAPGGSGDEVSGGKVSGAGGGTNGGGGPGDSRSTTSDKKVPCATTSDPEQGFTADTIKLGTIIPVSGSLRPLGEQTARVMQLAVDRINSIEKLPGPYPYVWGCDERPGVFGRKFELEIYSLQNQSPEEALAGMRRLIDVENVFLVRDCYLASNLLGPAVQYQNQQGVPGIWCYFSEMGAELAPWNYSPGINPNVAAAINTAYAMKSEKKRRVAIIADPSVKNTTVQVVRRVAAHLGSRIPADCIVYKKAQEASSGMRSEITRIRTCYGAQRTPDAVIALDALNAVFGAMEAKSQGWRGADNNVQWVCTGLSCWITTLADICGNACEDMHTNCASLPCVPWASEEKYPSVRNFNEFHEQYVPREPEDILTYAPQAITSGIAIWLTMTGPDLSREKFVSTLNGLDNWSAGIGPTITITDEDHFGSYAVWIIKYTGRNPYFTDVTGDFLTLQSLGVPAELTRT